MEVIEFVLIFYGVSQYNSGGSEWIQFQIDCFKTGNALHCNASFGVWILLRHAG